MQNTIAQPVLKALLAFASTDVTRPQLSSVHFAAVGGELWVAATDGHTAMRCRLAVIWGEDLEAFLVPVAKLKAFLKGSKTSDGFRLEQLAELGEVSDDFGKKIDQVFPEDPPLATQLPAVWGVNPKLLARLEWLVKGYHSQTGKTYQGIKLSYRGELDPLHAETGWGEDHFEAVIMPMRL